MLNMILLLLVGSIILIISLIHTMSKSFGECVQVPICILVKCIVKQVTLPHMALVTTNSWLEIYQSD